MRSSQLSLELQCYLCVILCNTLTFWDLGFSYTIRTDNICFSKFKLKLKTIYTNDVAPFKYKNFKKSNSVQFSHSVMSDSLWPQGLQHTRPPCPLQTPRVDTNSCPLSWWCHPTISSSVIPASTSVFSMKIQDWFPLGWTGWVSLQSKGLSRVFSNTTVQKHQFFSAQLSL